MRHALLICIKDLRQRLRDRTAILTAIVAPLVLTALMGLALGGSQGGSGMRLCIADLDHSKLSSGFVDFVKRPALRGMIWVQPVDSLPAAERMIQEHRAECAVVMSPGFIPAARNGAS